MQDRQRQRHPLRTLFGYARDLRAILLRLGQDRQGNFAILTALVSVVLLGIAGGAIDFSHALSVRTRLQDNLDATVLSAARESKGQRIVRAKELFSTLSASLSDYAPRARFNMDKDGVLSGSASASVKTTLMTVLSFEKLDVSAEAAAVASEAIVASTGAPCILLLDNGSDALYVNSGAGIQETACEIHVRSRAHRAANFTDGGPGLKVNRICIKSDHVQFNNDLNSRVEKSCDVASDELASSMPTVKFGECDWHLGGHLPDNRSKHKLSPGVYCGGTTANGSPTIEMELGLYVIKQGNWHFNSGTTLKGKDVTIYLADTSQVFFNGNVNIDLTAPTDGPYKNILFFEAPGISTSGWLFNGTPTAKLDGIMHLPSRNMEFNSTFSMTNSRAGMVFNRMRMDGTDWNLTPLSEGGGTTTTAGKGVRLVH
jgi:hypothetical protein